VDDDEPESVDPTGEPDLMSSSPSSPTSSRHWTLFFFALGLATRFAPEGKETAFFGLRLARDGEEA
jgi:hypothetical protein